VDEFSSHLQQVSRGGTKVSVKVRNGNATEAAPQNLSDAVSQLVDLTLDMLERQDLKPFQEMVRIGTHAVKTWERDGRKVVYKDDWKDEGKLRRWLSTFIGLLRQDFTPIELLDLYEEESDTITNGQFIQLGKMGGNSRHGGPGRLATSPCGNDLARTTGENPSLSLPHARHFLQWLRPG
jgi:hypothetical protein